MLEDNGSQPPCDDGGLEACPYWKTHGVSPAVLEKTEPEDYTPELSQFISETLKLDPRDFLPISDLDWLAWELYNKYRDFGWEITSVLSSVELNSYEANEIFERFYVIRLWEVEWQREMSDTGSGS